MAAVNGFRRSIVAIIFHIHTPQLIDSMVKSEGVTEALKAKDPMKWVGLMNSIKASAEEVVISRIICYWYYSWRFLYKKKGWLSCSFFITSPHHFAIRFLLTIVSIFAMLTQIVLIQQFLLHVFLTRRDGFGMESHKNQFFQHHCIMNCIVRIATPMQRGRENAPKQWCLITVFYL